jgi:hypothetical protein
MKKIKGIPGLTLMNISSGIQGQEPTPSPNARSLLFVPQRYQRIKLCCAARWNIGRHQCDPS